MLSLMILTLVAEILTVLASVATLDAVLGNLRNLFNAKSYKLKILK